MFLFLIERLDRQLAPVFCMKCQKGYFQDIVLLDLELTYKLSDFKMGCKREKCVLMIKKYLSFLLSLLKREIIETILV